MTAKWKFKPLAYIQLTEIEQKVYQRIMAHRREGPLGVLEFLAIYRATQEEYELQRQYKECGACNFHPKGCPEGSHA